MAELKQIVRIANADLVGTRPIYNALRQIKGISYAFANAICNLLNFEKDKKVGSLTDEEVKKINYIIRNPKKYNIPNWLFNRRKDFDTGEDLHLIASDLKLRKEFDIKNLKGIKSYRGMRHAFGLPVRGQRTRAHFRKGAAIGVRRKGVKMVPKEEKGRAARKKAVAKEKPTEKAEKKAKESK